MEIWQLKSSKTVLISKVWLTQAFYMQKILTKYKSFASKKKSIGSCKLTIYLAIQSSTQCEQVQQNMTKILFRYSRLN